MKLTVDGHDFEVQVEDGAVTVNGTRYPVTVKGDGLTRFTSVAGRAIRVDLGETVESGPREVNVEGKIYQVTRSGAAAPVAVPSAAKPGAGGAGAPAPRAARPSKGTVTAQMSGRIVRIEVAPGATVASGDLLLILEAMKMENEIRSPRAGTVKRVAVGVGDRVSNGDALVEFEE